jgi:hypothetical protein
MCNSKKSKKSFVLVNQTEFAAEDDKGNDKQWGKDSVQTSVKRAFFK